MSGALLQVLGHPRFLPQDGCPDELLEEIVTLISSEGDAFEVDVEAASMSRTIMADIRKQGVSEEVRLPLKTKTLSKVVEYFKYHKDVPPGAIEIPMPSEDLVECGALKWDAAFIKVDKDMLFELMVAAKLLDIASLLLLTAAKAASLVRDKESAALRKLVGVRDDWTEEEEEELNEKLVEDRQKLGIPNADAQSLPGVAAILHGLASAAEKSGILAADGSEPSVQLESSTTSWSQMNWRAAVLTNWARLEEAPAELRGDRELMFAAVSVSCGQAIWWVADELRSDAKLFLHVVRCNPSLLSEASMELRGDRDFMLEAVEVNGEALACASEELRGDRGFVLEASRRSQGSALQGASDALRADAELVLQCLGHGAAAFRGAAEELRSRWDFALQAAEANGHALQHMSRGFKADREIVAAAAATSPEAAVFAHTSRRTDLGLALPWDTGVAHHKKVESDIKAGKRRKDTLVPPPRSAYPNLKWRDEAGGCKMMMRCQKSVQFSAMNTMVANMGQFNYISSNSYLDKLPFYERPEIDSFTLMWGPVGAIGMRAKAFASADMLNFTPDNLMSVLDASKILHTVCCLMNPPEWFNPCFFDEASRAGYIRPTAGLIQGENYWCPPPLPGRGALQSKKPEAEEQPKEEAESESLPGPLGGWPKLAIPLGQDLAVEAADLELVEGARVQLTGLPSQNGITGTVLKKHADGRWKVMLDGSLGRALLKAAFLHVIESPAALPAAGDPAVPPAAAGPPLPGASTAPVVASGVAVAAVDTGVAVQDAVATRAAPSIPKEQTTANDAAAEVAAKVEDCTLTEEPVAGTRAAAAERRRQELEERRAATRARTEARKAACKADAEARRAKAASRQAHAAGAA